MLDFFVYYDKIVKTVCEVCVMKRLLLGCGTIQKEPATIKLYEKLILGDETYKGVQRLKKGETLTLKHFK